MRVEGPLAKLRCVGVVHVDHVVHRADERQRERAAREPAVVREPHPVQPAQNRRQHQRPAQLFRNRRRGFDLLDLKRHQRLVALHDLLVHGLNRRERFVLRLGPGPLGEHRQVDYVRGGYPRGVGHEHTLLFKRRITVEVPNLFIPKPRVGLPVHEALEVNLIARTKMKRNSNYKKLTAPCAASQAYPRTETCYAPRTAPAHWQCATVARRTCGRC